jgi:histidinol-phosphatase (PHP family)
MIKTNYHTHSTFCDGKESAEEMVRAAEQKGFAVLGFSSHAMFPFSDSWHIHITPGGYEAYMDEMARLKEAYRGRMEILAGFEADYIPNLTKPDMNDMEYYGQFKPDFLIGSVHFVLGDGGYYEADGPRAETRERIAKYFGGDVRRAVTAYFEAERQMLRTSRFTVLGHADVIRKQNGGRGVPLFCEDEDWYREELEKTADAAAEAGVIVEINTGGMARGYMDSPFPSPAFLRLLRARNVPAMINSDAHKGCNLDFAFDEAVQLAQAAGYTELAYLDGEGVKSQQVAP